MQDQEGIESQYDSDLEIDPNALDVACLLQAQLFQKYSRLKAMAVRTAKRMHERVKTIKAELTLAAGEGGEDLIGTKVTNPSIDAWVRTHPRYKKAKEKMIQAEFIADLLDGAVFAFHQRKAQLENLINLMTMEYFARPKEPRDLPEELQYSKKAQRTLRQESTAKSKKAAAKLTDKKRKVSRA